MKNKKTDLQLEKNKIRQKILEKRNNLSTEEVEKKSDLIIENLGKFIKNTESILDETLEISQRYLEKALLNIENLGNDNVKEELVFVMDKLARREN